MKKILKTVNQYPVIVQADQLGGYFVTCPVLPGCYSQGETIDEALKNIGEAIALGLEELSQKDKNNLGNAQISLHLVQI
ncbi:MAG: type II toxin-antitoxin system HicB family antitoxin [Patescibacteria group bacterium]|jgi:predicted RNase H-like HicB family nuclease